ncbi:hypothetical protein BDZ91DRAFT_785504 [Kalaharituber pfeilii]|nr:hypothetical protein BDZ91DRAFT_785504 [Kalaharituber pfeilii]
MAAKDIEFLKTDLFKIVLKNPSSTPIAPTASTDNDTPGSASPIAFFVHRGLLASLSEELHKHTNNEMREGREGVMELSEVDEATMKAFVEWAYWKDYTTDLQKGPAALLYHTKIYVLADRFNVVTLKGLAYSRITAMLAEIGVVAEKADVEAMVAVVNYAFGNLPFSSSNPKIISVPREPLLKYFAHYTSWALDVFTTSDAFCDLLVQCPDFAQALVFNSNPARRPPWVDAVSQGSDGEVVKPPEVSVTSEEDKSHILSRHCSNCGYIGVMSIMCWHCSKVDNEIGVRIKIDNSVLWTVGQDRIYGEKQDFYYTCKWCNKKKNYYGSALDYSSHDNNNYSLSGNLGSLICRKCTKPGYYRKLTFSN